MKPTFAIVLMAATTLATTAMVPAALAQTTASSSAQAPSAASAEQDITRSLNTQVSQRLLEAERKEAADAAAYREAMARYEAEVARYNDRSAQVAQTLEVRRDNIDHEQDLYNQRMAEWRATVAACEAGDRVRCASGKAPAEPVAPRGH